MSSMVECGISLSGPTANAFGSNEHEGAFFIPPLLIHQGGRIPKAYFCVIRKRGLPEYLPKSSFYYGIVFFAPELVKKTEPLFGVFPDKWFV
jgi:hypothetical protein